MDKETEMMRGKEWLKERQKDREEVIGRSWAACTYEKGHFSRLSQLFLQNHIFWKDNSFLTCPYVSMSSVCVVVLLFFLSSLFCMAAWSVCLSVCLFVCLCVCMFVCLYVCVVWMYRIRKATPPIHKQTQYQLSYFANLISVCKFVCLSACVSLLQTYFWPHTNTKK